MFLLFKFGKCFDFVLRYFNSIVFIEVSGDRLGNKNVVVIIIDGFVNKGCEKDVFDVILVLKVGCFFFIFCVCEYCKVVFKLFLFMR